VAWEQLRWGATVSLGKPLQQCNIRDRLFPRRACLYGDACHVGSLEGALGIKSPAGGGGSRAFFNRLTVRQLARKLGLTQFYTEDAMVGLPPMHSRIRDSGMGHFRVPVQGSNRAGERSEPIEAIVDSAATYNWR